MHGNSRIGSHSVLSYIDVQDQVIPDNVVLHGLKQRNGKFIVRIFGVNDNPKENRLFICPCTGNGTDHVYRRRMAGSGRRYYTWS